MGYVLIFNILIVSDLCLISCGLCQLNTVDTNDTKWYSEKLNDWVAHIIYILYELLK